MALRRWDYRGMVKCNWQPTKSKRDIARYGPDGLFYGLKSARRAGKENNRGRRITEDGKTIEIVATTSLKKAEIWYRSAICPLWLLPILPPGAPEPASQKGYQACQKLRQQRILPSGKKRPAITWFRRMQPAACRMSGVVYASGNGDENRSGKN